VIEPPHTFETTLFVTEAIISGFEIDVLWRMGEVSECVDTVDSELFVA
jgi:hypothetical protein